MIRDTSPGQDGGSDYGGPAFSQRTGLFYVSGKNDAVSNRVRPVGSTLSQGRDPPATSRIWPKWGKPACLESGDARPMTGHGRQVWYTEFPGWTNASLVVTAATSSFMAPAARRFLRIRRATAQLSSIRTLRSPDAQRAGIADPE